VKILVTSIGTRGDMEPFLAIGEILAKKGHQVVCMFPEQFRSLAEESGFGFVSLGMEFMEMLESDIGKFALGGKGSRLKKIRAFIKLAKIQQQNNKLMIDRQFKAISEWSPDHIVHNGKVMYPVIWEIDNPGKTAVISPVPYLHYVKRHTHTAFHSDYGTGLNKLTFKIADWGVERTIMSAAAWLKLTGVTRLQVKHAMSHHKIIYTISPTLFPRPDYWKENMKVLGFHERDRTVNWSPDSTLLDFLAKHSKIMFVTFGSMTNPEPKKKTEIILNILKRHNIPAIINTSSGGLVKPGSFDEDLFHFVSMIPYAWIFPKVYSVIHHGGSGTTHATLKNGCATMIIPHIIDQFIWNDMVFEKGAGPRGIRIGDITEKNLEPKVLSLVNNHSYKKEAENIAAQMKREDLTEALYEEIIR
jgi:UDP:flavonoid glycosyltransferase YjiC (YdhE family)